MSWSSVANATGVQDLRPSAWNDVLASRRLHHDPGRRLHHLRVLALGRVGGGGTLWQAGAATSSRDLFAFADDYDPGGIWPVDLLALGEKQCTAFAAWRVQVNHPEAVGFWNYTAGQLPHAKRWANAAVAFENYAHEGVNVSTMPRVGDIAQWTSGEYGHVAFVAAVVGPDVFLEEYYNRPTSPLAYSTRRITTADAENFIHFGNSALTCAGPLHCRRGPAAVDRARGRRVCDALHEFARNAGVWCGHPPYSSVTIRTRQRRRVLLL